MTTELQKVQTFNKISKTIITEIWIIAKPPQF